MLFLFVDFFLKFNTVIKSDLCQNLLWQKTLFFESSPKNGDKMECLRIFQK